MYAPKQVDMDTKRILIAFWVCFRSYPGPDGIFSWFLGFQKNFMVPADYENQLFRYFPDFSWENDLFFWIRHIRIDYVPEYLS